ncbi:AlpA family transcriptional regulator [Thioalkalivibrio sp. ALE12]|uniref:helix-turn-helix transcriptional regulator n=1 Tax=Thioalkalivibrio sp. ALE12 TaxID=1158170 RepID=UPI000375D66D|nr:AlpA family phage regulatory protein [Thioalkalivibrio sp. ALE12]
MNPVQPELLRQNDVIRMTGMSRTTIYRLRRRGEFPPPRTLGTTIAWRRRDVEEWINRLPEASE